MKNPAAIIIALLSVGLIASAVFFAHLYKEAKPSISSGTITAKRYFPETESTTLMCGHPAICIPVDTVEPEKWIFSLETYQDGKPVSGWVRVPESVYNSYEVGSPYGQ